MNRKSLLAGLLLTFAVQASHAAERVLTVFAAASLTNVMEDLGKAFTARTQVPVRFSFAASSALARQIESGAPADVFASADQEWMDYLAARGLIQLATRRDIAANALVLVAPAGSTTQLKITPGFDLGRALGSNGRLSTGDPATVPAGRYARTALTRLGVWDSIANRIIPADNVRTALNFVARGEAPLGIVYATDARVDGRVRVVDVFPADSQERITYPAAATGNATPAAREFMNFLGSDAARAIFGRAGFTLP